MESDVTIELNGKEFSGSYIIANNMMTVYYKDHNKCTQVDGMVRSPELLAKQLLRTIISRTK